MIDFKKLSEPFPENDVEWRLQSCGETSKGVWAICLAYITNRAIMQRLDDVCGPENWRNQFVTGPHGGVLCGISIKCGDEWVTKWDGAENTQVEAVKGGLSDSMKRAGYQWGIGRYLYSLDEGFAVISDNGKYRGKTKDNKPFKWNPPALPKWALPSGSAQPPKGNTMGGKKQQQADIQLTPGQEAHDKLLEWIDGASKKYRNQEDFKDWFNNHENKMLIDAKSVLDAQQLSSINRQFEQTLKILPVKSRVQRPQGRATQTATYF